MRENRETETCDSHEGAFARTQNVEKAEPGTVSGGEKERDGAGKNAEKVS